MEPEISYAKARDLSIAYSVMGEGPMDVVVVPGFVSHLEAAFEQPAISRFMRRLAAFSRVITFDKRGTGLSDPVEGAPTLEERMEDLTAVLEAAGAARPALIGISEGGPMSALFAATYPGRTRALIVYGSYAKGLASDDYPWAPGPEQVQLATEMIDAEWGQGVFLGLYAPSAVGDEAFSSWWARYQRLAGSPSMAKAVSRLATEVDIRSILPAISVPTLVLHRVGDRLWPIDGARYLAAEIPGARLVELEGVDHIPFVGDTELIADEIEAFLTGTRHSTAPGRQLLTVLFTDIVGSTERAVELGDRRWRAVLDQHDDLTREQVKRFGGRAIKSTGDGFLATFDGPTRGVECADAIRAGVATHGIEVRAGLHTGECEIRGEDVAGMAVHIGARVAGLAEAGEILVSRTVRDLAVGSEIDFELRGSHSLKGVADDWELFAVPPMTA